jgi:hypothetical protein
MRYRYRLRVLIGMRANNNNIYDIAWTDSHDSIMTPLD